MKKIKLPICMFLIVVSVVILSACQSQNSKISRQSEFKNNGLGITSEQMSVRQISFDNDQQIEKLAPLVAPAVVGIQSGNNYNSSIGSGVCIDKEGTILTNAHVVNSNNITLFLADGSTTNATLIKSDHQKDLALLKSQKSIPFLTLAQNDEIVVGTPLLAIGTPLDLIFSQSVTKGIISATERELDVDTDSGKIMTMKNLIQHDAPINPGNSGGPIISASGKILGINTLKVEDAEGMGFAISAQTIRDYL